jgi:hypothetical protein
VKFSQQLSTQALLALLARPTIWSGENPIRLQKRKRPGWWAGPSSETLFMPRCAAIADPLVINQMFQEGIVVIKIEIIAM